MSKLVPSIVIAALLLSSVGPLVAAEPDEEFRRVTWRVEQIRGLKFTADVERSLLDRRRFQQRLRRNAANNAGNKEIRAVERVLVTFGLAPEGVDLLESNTKYLGEAVGGFYDSNTKKLYVVGSDKKLDAVTESIYSHELTHALQDQHFDLKRVRKRLTGNNDDVGRALTSLIEGDATAVQNTYVRSTPGLAKRIRTEQGKRRTNPNLLKNTPRIIVESFRFPYSAGSSFVAALFQHGGLKAVNSAYKDPPTSTEQVLHPQKYINRDQPTQVKLPNLSTPLGTGWKKLSENTFGEFGIDVLFLGKQQSRRAFETALTKGAGWDGDRYALYTNRDYEVLIWETVWDTAKDAEEFAAALRAYDEGRFKSQYKGRGDTLTLVSAARAAIIVQDRLRVRYVMAPTVVLAREVLDARAGGGRVIPDAVPNTGAGGLQRP